MKTNTLIKIVLVCVLAFSLAACSKSGGQKFIGTWTPVVGEANITISQDGDLYVLTGYPFDRTAFTYKDGVLKGTGLMGDLTFSESSKHIYFFNREYQKLPSPTNQ
jgi:uncharacterized lipoprotein YehR (DUF1307 family)